MYGLGGMGFNYEDDQAQSRHELKEEIEKLKKTVERLANLTKAAGEGVVWMLKVPESEGFTNDDFTELQKLLPPNTRLIVLPTTWDLQNLDDEQLASVGLMRNLGVGSLGDRASYDYMLMGRKVR